VGCSCGNQCVIHFFFTVAERYMLPIIADEVYEYAVSMQVIQFTSFSRNYSIHRNRIK